MCQDLNKDAEKLIIRLADSIGNQSLPELVEKLVKDEGLKYRDVARMVYVLWKQGTLELTEPKPPSNLIGYILSLRSLWFWAITVLVALTTFIVFYVATPPLIYMRYVLGSIFVLYLPGSMLIEALYPRSEDLESLERLALSIGLSLAVVPLIGLILNYTPWGIRLTPIVISLATFTETMAVLALVRKYRYYRLNLK
jgi:hypothetical protein